MSLNLQSLPAILITSPLTYLSVTPFTSVQATSENRDVVRFLGLIRWIYECRGRASNPHAPRGTQDFKSCASANSATPAKGIIARRSNDLRRRRSDHGDRDGAPASAFSV